MAMPDFPPRIAGFAAPEPRVAAIEAALQGCDGGTIFWRAGGVLEVALVLAPDVALGRAAQMLPLALVAMRDALGAIGPPELPVHLSWEGGFVVNGAEAGRGRIVAPKVAPEAVPDWLVVHLTLRFAPDGGAGTALLEEGCGDIEPVALLESWSRHVLHRLSEWEDGAGPLHAELRAAAWEVETKDASFLGRDEGLGRLRRVGGATILDPLTDLLEAP